MKNQKKKFELLLVRFPSKLPVAGEVTPQWASPRQDTLHPRPSHLQRWLLGIVGIQKQDRSCWIRLKQVARTH